MYAVKSDGSFRAVQAGWVLSPDETLSESLPAPVNPEQQKRREETAVIETLKAEYELAILQGNTQRQKHIKREISRIKYISQGV